MISLFFLLSSMSLGMSLIFISTPVCLGAWILLFSMFSSMFLSSIYVSWFGYIMFLIYIGGMLVMFSYFTAIQPNQDIFITKPFYYWMIIYLLLPINASSFSMDLFTSSFWWISSMFNSFNTMCLILVGLVLFLALVSVVKVTITSFSPLRPFMT